MKVSARNSLAGIITSIKPGAIDALQELKLEVGSKAFAIIKASNVILGIE